MRRILKRLRYNVQGCIELCRLWFCSFVLVPSREMNISKFSMILEGEHSLPLSLSLFPSTFYSDINISSAADVVKDFKIYTELSY